MSEPPKTLWSRIVVLMLGGGGSHSPLDKKTISVIGQKK